MPSDRENAQMVAHVMQVKGWIDLPARGSSMFPLIRQNDVCRFIPCQAEELKKGDIGLFHDSAAGIVAHRFYRSIPLDDKLHYLFKGDANAAFDPPIGQEQLLGKLVYIRKHKANIGMDRAVPICWGKAVVSFPVLSRALRGYLIRKEQASRRLFGVFK